MQSKADLHFHTWHSIDSLISPKAAVDLAVEKGVRVLAITDHDSIDGAFAARAYAEKHNLPVEIIIGEEIYSNAGHIIGLFLSERVESFLPVEDTLAELKRQNAIIIIPHLLFDEDVLGEYLYRYKVSYLDLIKNAEFLDAVHGVEVENFSIMEDDFSEKANFMNGEFLKKARISSSDSHIKLNFGYSYTLFEGSTAEDLRKAILEKTTVPVSTKRQQRLAYQLMGWGPIFKFPIHLSLQFSYRVLKSIYNTTKKLFKSNTKKHEG